MVIYNDLEEIEDAVRSLNPTVLTTFDVSCFSGKYPTEEVHLIPAQQGITLVSIFTQYAWCAGPHCVCCCR